MRAGSSELGLGLGLGFEGRLPLTMRLGLGLGLVSGSPPFDHAARVRVRASGSPPFDHAARVCVRVSVKKRLSPQSPNRPNQWPETALYSAAPLRRLRPAGLPASPADVFAGSCRDRRPARRRGTPRLGFGRKNDKVRKALAAVACPARAAAAPARLGRDRRPARRRAHRG